MDWFSYVLDNRQRLAIPVGPRFQIDVPEWNGPPQRKYPHRTLTKSESSKWLGTVIWSNKETTPETERDVIGRGRPDHCDCHVPGSIICVKRHITEKTAHLQKDLGPAFQIWKFDEMGGDVTKLWKQSEQQNLASFVNTNLISEVFLLEEPKDDKQKKRKRTSETKGDVCDEKKKKNISRNKEDSDDEERITNIVKKVLKKLHIQPNEASTSLDSESDPETPPSRLARETPLRRHAQNRKGRMYLTPKSQDFASFENPRNLNKKRDIATVEVTEKIYNSPKDYPCIRSRVSPNSLMTAIRSMNEEQKQAVIDIGFGSILNMKFEEIPTRIGYFVVDNFDERTGKIKLKNGSIHVTKQVIHDMLGVPMGGLEIKAENKSKSDDAVTLEWRSQFDKPTIRPTDVARMIANSNEAGRKFKLNFLVLFASCMAEGTKLGICNQKFLPSIGEDIDIKTLDWCGYIMDCLKVSKVGWNRDNRQSFYSGPLTLLTLFYVDSTKCTQVPVLRKRPAIVGWTLEQLRQREVAELKLGFGRGDIEEKFEECEVVNGGNQVCNDPGEKKNEEQEDPHYGCRYVSKPTTAELKAQEFIANLEAKYAHIMNLKEELDSTLCHASAMFPENEKIKDLNKKVGILFGKYAERNETNEVDADKGEEKTYQYFSNKSIVKVIDDSILTT